MRGLPKVATVEDVLNLVNACDRADAPTPPIAKDGVFIMKHGDRAPAGEAFLKLEAGAADADAMVKALHGSQVEESVVACAACERGDLLYALGDAALSSKTGR